MRSQVPRIALEGAGSDVGDLRIPLRMPMWGAGGLAGVYRVSAQPLAVPVRRTDSGAHPQVASPTAEEREID